jgi:hypothetical protein
VRILSADEPTRSSAEFIGEASTFNLFFISYATKDRSEVIKRLQMLKVTGKNFRQDLLDLEPSDRWERKLYEFIDECDAVLLFWSTSAKESEWVMRECKYAIEKKGIERIIPVIIEGLPPVVPPPRTGSITHERPADVLHPLGVLYNYNLSERRPVRNGMAKLNIDLGGVTFHAKPQWADLIAVLTAPVLARHL